jgi:hypothetical protein
VSGRIARCVLGWSGDPTPALEAASLSTGALLCPQFLAEALQQATGGGFIVAIRREDRERFEETIAGVYSRWIGETTTQPGLLFS